MLLRPGGGRRCWGRGWRRDELALRGPQTRAGAGLDAMADVAWVIKAGLASSVAEARRAGTAGGVLWTDGEGSGRVSARG